MEEFIVFDFDTVIDRSGTGSLKWQNFERGNILPMWVADMDFASPPAVIEALSKRIEHGVYGYTVAPKELVELVVERCRQRYGWSVDPKWLVWLPGVVPGLNIACRAFTRPGDAVATFTPVYPPFLEIPVETERTLCRIPLGRKEEHFEIDPERFIEDLSPATRLLLLCHPHNPVGRVFSEDSLRAIARICRQRNIVVCSDEIYADLILDDTPHRPFITLAPDMTEHTVTLLSPGKTFNITGLNIGMAIIPNNHMRAQFKAIASHLVPHPNLLAYTAATAAYRDGEPWRQALLKVLRGNSELVYNFVNSNCDLLQMDPVQATYLAWIDARALKGEDPINRFRRAGVELSSGRPFGADGFVRLNFGCPRATLTCALDRLDKALNTFRNGDDIVQTLKN